MINNKTCVLFNVFIFYNFFKISIHHSGDLMNLVSIVLPAHNFGQACQLINQVINSSQVDSSARQKYLEEATATIHLPAKIVEVIGANEISKIELMPNHPPTIISSLLLKLSN